jgi:hypothetical protein
LPKPNVARTWSRREFLQSMLAGSAGLTLAPRLWAQTPPPALAQGIVFHDQDGDGRRGPGDPGIEGVAVSNGRAVTLTDSRGRWRLPVEGDSTTFFVIKPRGWKTRLSRHHLCLHYYHHHPHGSPRQRFPGVPASGALPESIDFALSPQDEPDRFKALVCGDPQPRDLREVGYLAQTVVPDLVGTEAAFGVSLGDIAFDNLDTLEPLSQVMGLVGVPWHHVPGNHDVNREAADNRQAFETFRRVFGPTYSAFQHGPVHFLLLNNIEWTGKDAAAPDRQADYRGGLGERQLEFVANYLPHVPREQLVVLLMHIPLQCGYDPSPRMQTVDRPTLYRLLEDRPHTLSFSAHTHILGHLFLDAADGWHGPQPHHHIMAGALCGSWFRGAPDERGVPHATMSDGTPRGYLEVEFDGHRYALNGYRSLGRPREYQMHIELPSRVARSELARTPVAVNVFNGTERSEVRMRCDATDRWRPLTQVRETDPRAAWLHERDRQLASPYYSLPAPMARCPHLWKAPLPQDLEAGMHLLEVAATDMFGHTHRAVHPLEVT